MDEVHLVLGDPWALVLLHYDLGLVLEFVVVILQYRLGSRWLLEQLSFFDDLVVTHHSEHVFLVDVVTLSVV